MEAIVNNKVIGFPIIQNQQDFVIAKFNIKQIFSFTKYTARILNSFDEQGEPIYNEEIQRKIEKRRVETIADFLIEDPKATFPTNIVLHIPIEAIESQNEFIKEHINFVEIELKQRVFDEFKKNKIFISIIDGQHRIRGIEIALQRIKNDIKTLSKIIRGKTSSEFLEKKLKDKTQRLKDLENIELVVSFFIDKTIEYQAMIFSTINRTQKRVSQSLVYDLFGLNTGDSPQKTAIQVIIRLNGHKSSPFYKRIKFYGGNYSSENSPPLSQATMAKSIVNLISENMRESERDKYRTRKELNSRSVGSNKFLPFRKHYANNKDSMISDIMFYYFNSVRNTFKDENGNSLWNIGETGKPDNILHTTVGYVSLLRILVEILQEKKIEVKNTKHFENYLQKCKSLKLDNIIRYPFNNKGKKILYLDMSLVIWPPNPNNDKDNRLIELKEITAD